MQIEVIWDDEAQTVLRYIVHDGWTWDEFYEARHLGTEMALAAHHAVPSIIDFTQVHSVGNGALTHFTRAAKAPRTYPGLVVMLGIRAPLLKAIISVISRVYPEMKEKISFADTLDEARRLIRSTVL